MFPSNGRRRGFTLAEMIVSAAILSLLAATMMSAVLIASHALPVSDRASAVNAEAVEAVDQIAADLMYAVTLTEPGSEAITCTVADRGHGAPGDETIRYAWSGTAGDPLTRSYNGATPVTVCPSVRSFSISYTKTTAALTHTPRVVLVVGNAGSLGSDDTQRYDLLTSWGFDVVIQDDGADSAAFDAVAAGADVIYISERVLSYKFKDKAWNMSLGVVTEEGFLLSSYGIADGSQTKSTSSMLILDSAHPITAGFPEDWLTICTTDDILYECSDNLAPGARILATYDDSKAALLTIELNDRLNDGQLANARRVKLPWGGDYFFEHFKMVHLNDEAHTILRRAIVWAAAPVVYDAVHVTLQTTDDPASRAESDIQLLNQPEVSKP